LFVHSALEAAAVQIDIRPKETMAETIKTILEADASGYVRQFERASKASSQLNKEATNSFKGIAAAAGGMLGAGLAIGAVVGQFNSLREEFDRVGKLATRLDLPVADVQVLSQVAIDAGTDMEKLANGLQKAQIAALEARDGTGAAGAAFKTLGIDAGEFAQANAVDRMKALADGFKGVGNEAEATRAVVKVMGARVALDLIPALKGGAESVDKMRNSLRVLSEQDIRSIEKMNDDMDLLSKNLQVDMATAMAAITPDIIAVVKLLGDALRGFAILRDGAAGGVGVGANSEFDGAAILAQMRKVEAERAQFKESFASTAKWSFLPFALPSLRLAVDGMNDASNALQVLGSRLDSLDGEDKAIAVFTDSIGELSKLKLPAAEFESRVRILEAQRDASIAVAQAERERLQAEKDAAAAAVKAAADEEAAIIKLSSIREKAQEILRKGELAGLDEQTALHVRRGQIEQQAGGGEVSSDGMRQVFEAATKPEEAEKALNLYQQLLDLERDEARISEEKAKNEEKIAEQLAGQITSRQAIAGELAALQIETGGDKAKADALREEMQLRAQALDLAKQSGLADDAALKLLHQKQELQAAIAESKLAEAGAKFTGEIGVEVRALQMELSGRKDLAETLRAEVQLRAKAKEVAAQTNITEEDALKLLQEKAKLQKEVEGMVDGRRARRRGLLDEEDSNKARLARRSKADRDREGSDPKGLRAEEERRRAAQREMEKKAKEAADPAKFWSKSLDLQEEMLKVFKGLGIV
jgi:hypothetical protein